MAEETKSEEKSSETPDLDTLKKENEEFRQKQENLNQGIAKYRDEAQKSSQQVKDLEERLGKLESSSEVEGEEVKLAPQDEAKLEAWLKNKGLVTKAEFEQIKGQQNQVAQQELHNQAVTEFLEKHSEYNTDENWKEIQAQFGLYRTPTTLQNYRKVLEKIHKDLSIPNAEKRGGDKARAEMTTKGRLSLGGGSQKSSTQDEEIENLTKKYPHLSKEQIEDNLKDVDALYPDKK